MAVLSTSANIATPGLPVGSIQAFAGANAPTGWLLCDGSAVSRGNYPDLYNTIGNTYGSGDGSTTFNLPDLRGRIPLGAGTGSQNGGSGSGTVSGGTSLTSRTRGQFGGDERLATHNHGVTDPGHYHGAISTAGSGGGPPNNSANWTVGGASGGANNTFGLTGQTTTGISVQNNSNGGSGGNMPPFLVTNYIIKAVADIARGGWYTQSSPPTVTQLPSNPAIGEEVYQYNSNTGRYLHRRWNGTSWSYVGNNILQILMTTDTGSGSHNLTSYGIVSDLTTTITTNGDSRIMVDGNLGSMQPGTGNAMAVVKCDYNNTSTSSSDFTNLVAGTSAEWSHNGYDLKNLPFGGMTGTLAAGTYTFRVKIKSIQGYVLQWNWHSMQDQISWLKLTEIGVV